jgi:hypothetical protein
MSYLLNVLMMYAFLFLFVVDSLVASSVLKNQELISLSQMQSVTMQDK